MNTSEGRLPTGAAACLTLVFAIVLVRTAWIGDDALISFRSVLNVTHGFGLTFNITERVQTFTHPLWLGLLTAGYLVVGNIYYTAFLLCIALALAAFWMTLRHASGLLQGAVAAGVLMSSRAFVDYSTSGLENVLLFVLLVWVVSAFANERFSAAGRLGRLAFLTSLLYLTRPDAILLGLPLLVIALVRVGPVREALAPLVVGFLPVVAWTIFSVIYYGFPFPNTAYAKLASGTSQSELWRQGVVYLIDSVDRDPVTLVAVAMAAFTLVWARRDVASRGLFAGIALYVLYVVRIGGDFMTGRFLAAPVFGAALVLARARGIGTPQATAMAIALGAAALAGSVRPLTSDSNYATADARSTGIVDERAIYFRSHSLVRASRSSFTDPDWPMNDGVRRRLFVQPTCGLLGGGGVEMGPYAHLLDECALTDPLLARLPSVWNEEWRSGHFRRMVPDRYVESLENRANLLTDRGLYRYYDDLRLVTRSRDLLSLDRLRAIARLNFGQDDHLIDRTYYRYQGEVASLEDLSAVRDDASDAGAAPRRAVEGLAVIVPDERNRRFLDISIESSDRVRLSFIRRNRVVSRLEIGPVPEYRRLPGMSSYTLDVPARARERGFDTIFVEPTGGDPPFPVGHLLLEGFGPTDGELYRRVEQRDDMPPRPR